jgi:hypothetical protein
MTGPKPLTYLLVVAMLATSAYFVGRIVVAVLTKRALRYDVNTAHVVMGVGMAGMLLGGLRFGPVVAWEVVFGLLTVWFLLQAARLLRARGWQRWDDYCGQNHLSHYFAHLAMSASMFYMFAAGMYSSSVASGSMMLSQPSGDYFLPAGAFTLLLIMAALWQLDGLGNKRSARSPVPIALADGGEVTELGTVVAGAPLAPRLETVSHVLMCLTMGYMLAGLL